MITIPSSALVPSPSLLLLHLVFLLLRMSAIGGQHRVLVLSLTTSAQTIFLSLFFLLQGSLVWSYLGIDNPYTILAIVLFFFTLAIIVATLHRVHSSTQGSWRIELEKWLCSHPILPGHKSAAPAAATHAAAAAAPTATSASATSVLTTFAPGNLRGITE